MDCEKCECVRVHMGGKIYISKLEPEDNINRVTNPSCQGGNKL